MDTSQLAKTKKIIEAELSAVEKRYNDLKNALNALTALINQETVSHRDLSVDSYPIRGPKASQRGHDKNKELNVTPSKRVAMALKSMNGEFTRMQLYEQACKDGYGTIKMGSYSPIFSKLVKRGKVKLVSQGTSGLRRSLYVRADEDSLIAKDSHDEKAEGLF